MKKMIKLLSILAIVLCLSACDMGEQPLVKKEVEIEEMRSIMELATIECYFHNVAKSEELLEKGFLEFWKKDSIHFWIEYDGIVKIGLDATKLKMEVKDDKVTITLPQAVVLDAKVNPESLTKDSFYYDKNSEKPSEKDEIEAFNQSQKAMIDAASSNSALLNNARENAKELLENYVVTIGNATGVTYNIEWKYLD